MTIKQLTIRIMATWLIYSVLILIIITVRLFFETPSEMGNTGIQGFLKATSPPNYRWISDQCNYEANKRVKQDLVFPSVSQPTIKLWVDESGWALYKGQYHRSMEKLETYCPKTYRKLIREERKCKKRTNKYLYGGE